MARRPGRAKKRNKMWSDPIPRSLSPKILRVRKDLAFFQSPNPKYIISKLALHRMAENVFPTSHVPKGKARKNGRAAMEESKT